MLVIGIALCYLLGLAMLLAIGKKYSLAELAGYSFLLGMGTETVFLFLLDVVGIKYSQPVLIAVNLIVIAVLVGLNFKKLKDFTLDPDPRSFFQLKNINFPALFIGCIIAYLFYCISVKCLFWPALERDSIGGFDKQAYVMAIEGKLKISLFDYHLDGADGSYPPLYYASEAYMYLFGAEMGKIVTTLFFLSTILVFFDVVRKYIGATGASFFTLLFMITPEYFAHAALGLSNLPTTAYACAGGLATVAWIENREQKFFWLGAILMGFITWSRSDDIGFVAAALFIMGIDFLRTKDWKKLVQYGTIVVTPFIAWTLYLKFKIHNVPTGKFSFILDNGHWPVMMGYVNAFFFGKTHDYNGMGAIDGAQLYGFAFVGFFFFLVVNALILVYLAYKKMDWMKALKSQLNILLLFWVSFALYFMVFYFIDENGQSAPMWSLMNSSFKRGMFCFLPFVFFYSATNYGSAWLFGKLEKFRSVS